MRYFIVRLLTLPRPEPIISMGWFSLGANRFKGRTMLVVAGGNGENRPMAFVSSTDLAIGVGGT